MQEGIVLNSTWNERVYNILQWEKQQQQKKKKAIASVFLATEEKKEEINCITTYIHLIFFFYYFIAGDRGKKGFTMSIYLAKNYKIYKLTQCFPGDPLVVHSWM